MRGGGARRVSRSPEGGERRRRARDAHRPIERRGGVGLQRRVGRGARRVRGSARLPREAGRGWSSRGDPGDGGPLRQRRPRGGAGLHRAAQPPEADRGVAGAEARRSRTRAHPRGCGGGHPADRLRGRGHHGVSPDRGRCPAIHGDEHPPPGRAPGQRDALRPRPGSGADPRRRRPSPVHLAG